LVGEAFLQSLPVELQVSMDDVRVVGAQEGSDLSRRLS
jgi:hypothetical protein